MKIGRFFKMIPLVSMVMALGATLGWANGMMIVDRVPKNFRRPQQWIRPPRPFPRPVPAMVVLPVVLQEANVKIVDNVATTEIEEIFANESNVQLEATYIFPLHDWS